MYTSSPAVLVTGEMLKMYVGHRVRTVVQVSRVDGSGIAGQSTDGQMLEVKGSPSFPLSHFVCVIGVVEGTHSIRAEICTDFGEKMDATSYNRLCQLANGDMKKLFL